jgi:glycosyltransferase involved in cell wall biosynthesis
MDVTPLLGVRSGVARVVEGWWRGLAAQRDLDLVGYTLSWRDRSGAGVGAEALPLPAALATRVWRACDRPRVDRRLGHPDLVHATNHVAPGARAPRLLTVMDLSFVHDPLDAPPSVRAFDSSIRAAVDRGVRLHTISHAVAAELVERYDADVTVVYPGLDGVNLPQDARSKPAPRNGPPVVVALGNTIRRKRFPLLVDAFVHMAAEQPQARLVIAGAPGSDTDALAARVAAAPREVQDRIELRGRLSDRAVVELYAEATVLAHPSGYEGFGLPLLEAMAHGVPVVAAVGGATAEIVGNAGVLVGSLGGAQLAEELAAAMTALIDDQAKQSHLVELGYQRVAEFSWDKSVAQMADLYRSVVG